jgi:hypothetical protein
MNLLEMYSEKIILIGLRKNRFIRQYVNCFKHHVQKLKSYL